MNAILLSNIPHYHYLAEALQEQGYLSRYITAMALVGKQRPSRMLPGYWRTKLEGRRMHGIPAQKVRQIWMPEILERMLPRFHLLSTERGYWLNNHMFDAMAKKYVGPCDVFHFVSSVGLYAARKAKAGGARIICDVRQEHPAFQGRILREEAQLQGVPAEVTGRTFENKVLAEFELADYVIVPSQHARRTFLSEGFAEGRVIVIPYGVELNYFKPSPRRDSVFRVVYIGHVTLRKGLQYLLEAFRQLNLPNSELLLVGSLDAAMAPILAKYEGLFRYLPAMPKVELLHWYSNSSVFVLPSLADSYGLAVLEAMACELPVIITKNTGAEDAIEDGREGFVVPIRDVEALKQRLTTLYEDETKRREMGAAAKERAHQRTWEAYGAQSAAYYTAIQNGTDPAQAAASASATRRTAAQDV